MKFRILHAIFIVVVFPLIMFTTGIAQPTITFSEISPFIKQPLILGHTANSYFCLYPNDSTPQLVVYNTDLKEESRINWYSIAALKRGTIYQPFTLNNQLVILIHEKNESIVTVSCILLDEKGKRLSEKKLLTDYSYKGQLIQPYDLEVSKNGKYILIYRGAKLDEESIMFKGYLFDSNWDNIKQFSVPLDKSETEESWDGALVDIEGNIHSFVYTASDSWKLGSRISVYSLAKESDEVKSEKIEILKKRLLKYSISEDTSYHVFNMQGTLAWQHQKDALAGIAFVSIPYTRNRKISYASYSFSKEEKKHFAKKITAQSKLVTNSDIEYPGSLRQSGTFFTTIIVHGDVLNSDNNKSDFENRPVMRTDELYNPNKLSLKANATEAFTRASAVYDKQQLLDSQGKPVKQNSKNYKENPGTVTVLERLIILKNNQKGLLESSAIYPLNKSALPYYDDSFFSVVKNDAVFVVGYLMEPAGPALHVLSDNQKAGMKKIETPKYKFLILASPNRINEITSLFPYADIKTGQYGLAKISF